MNINVSINGKRVQLAEPASVAIMLAARGFDQGPCAVEVNEQLVPRRDHERHELEDGDRIEVVTLVGGG